MNVAALGRGCAPAVALTLLLAACGAASPASPSASFVSAPPASAVSGSAAANKPAASTAAGASSAASKPAAASAASQAGLTQIKVGVTSKDANYLFLYAAQDLGIFGKHGLNAEMIVGQPTPLVTGLNQGDIDFFAAPSVASQGAQTGLPIRIVYVAADQPLYFLIGDKGITQPSQLKGKQIAGSTPAQIPALAVRTLLQVDGLQPQDYTIVPAANDPARAALVENHTAAAGILGFNEAQPLLSAGYPLIDSTPTKVYFPIVGLALTQDMLQKRRDVAQRTIDAALEANKLLLSDKDKAVGVLVNEFSLKPDDAAKAYDVAKPTYTTNGRPSAKAVQFQLESDAQALNKPQAREDQVYDYSLLPAT